MVQTKAAPAVNKSTDRQDLPSKSGAGSGAGQRSLIVKYLLWLGNWEKYGPKARLDLLGVAFSISNDIAVVIDDMLFRKCHVVRKK